MRHKDLYVEKPHTNHGNKKKTKKKKNTRFKTTNLNPQYEIKFDRFT